MIDDDDDGEKRVLERKKTDQQDGSRVPTDTFWE